MSTLSDDAPKSENLITAEDDDLDARAKLIAEARVDADKGIEETKRVAALLGVDLDAKKGAEPAR